MIKRLSSTRPSAETIHGKGEKEREREGEDVCGDACNELVDCPARLSKVVGRCFEATTRDDTSNYGCRWCAGNKGAQTEGNRISKGNNVWWEKSYYSVIEGKLVLDIIGSGRD